MAPRGVNWLLRQIFAGEQKRLLRQLRAPRTPGYSHGVSLIALLEREAGEVPHREKPQDIEPDVHDPTSAELCLV